MKRGGLASILRAVVGAWDLLSRRQRWAAVGIAAMSISSSMLELAALSSTVPFVSFLIDRAAMARYPVIAAVFERAGLEGADDLAVTLFGAVVMLFLVVAFAFRLATSWAVEFFSLRLTNSLVRSVMGRTIRAPYTWLKAQSVAALSQRITADVSMVGQTIYPGALEILYGLTLLGLGMTVVISNSPPTVLAAIVTTSVLTISILAAMNPAMSRQAAIFRDRVVESNRLAFETFAIHKSIKVAAAEEPSVRRYFRAFRALNAARLAMTMISRIVPMLTLLLGQVGLVVVALAMLHSGLSPEALVAQLTLIVVIVARVLPTAAGLSGSMNKLIKAVPHYDGLVALLAELSAFERADAARGRSAVPDWRRLEFDAVTFRHAGSERDQINNLTLQFRRGGRFGIVGPSGAGKSTLVDLVLRLVDPTSGRILLDGSPIDAFSRSMWLSRIGYVAQEVPVIDDTVRRNVAFGIDDLRIDDEKVWRALAGAGLADDIRALPLGLSAEIGEAGGRLSGGQRQRLALARAIYGDADLLILDEATSGLDPATEATVLRNILDLPQALTLVMVTHRLSTTSLCDDVFVIADGRLVAQGSFERLMADASIARLLAGTGEGIPVVPEGV